MLILSFLFLPFLQNVLPCLVVRQPQIEMNGCQCPQINYIDRAGILKNEYGSYLANRPTFNPNVTVSDSCNVTVNVETQMPSYYFMIFRDGAPPIYSTRFTLALNFYPFSPAGLTCSQVDGQFEWQYYGGTVANMSFAFQLQDYTNGITCGKPLAFLSLTIYVSDYDIFELLCPNATNAMYWNNNGSMKYPVMLPRIGAWQDILDATCVDGTWWYNNIPLKVINVTCSDPINVITQKPMAIKSQCGCFELLQITNDNQYMKVYDEEGQFGSYILDTASVTYSSGNCTPQISCPNSDFVVFFSRNYRPQKFNTSSLPSILCQQTPLTFPRITTSRYWFVDGIMLSDPAFACLTAKPTINMNGCQCPQINFADQTTVRSNKYGSYLANRPISYPSAVNVSDNCTVTVDAPSSCDYDNYYFMIFRDNGPPVFNRHFLPDANVIPFNPTGLSCAKVDNEFQWQYYGGIVQNVSFALQSDDESCSCGAFPSSSQVYGQCDIFSVSCPNNTNAVYWMSLNMAFNLVLPKLGSLVVDDATCVSGKWYYNGMLLNSIQLYCSSPVSIINMKPAEYTYHCGCRDILVITTDNKYMQLYDSSQNFSNYTLTSASVTYSSANCAPQISCPNSDFVVFFSRNFGPMKYTPSQLPYVTCQPTPLSLDFSTASSFWFVDGIMLSEAAVACFSLL